MEIDKLKKQQVDAVEATISGKNACVSLPTGFGKSLVYQLLPVCAKELSSLISTDPFVVILSRVRGFVVKKTIIIIHTTICTCGVHRNVADSARPSLAF